MRRIAPPALRHTGRSPPLVVAIVAGTAGYSVGVVGPANLWTVLAAGVITLGIAVLGLMAICREDFNDTTGLALSTMASALRRGSR